MRMDTARTTAAAALAVVAIAAAGCASTGSVPHPFPVPRGAAGRPTLPPVEAVPTGEAAAPVEVARPGDLLPTVAGNQPERPDPAPLVPVPDALTATALELLGTPYVNGGSTPDGFDCSGFTQWVFARHGLVLPRDTLAQYEAGTDVDPDALEPGDLIFFRTRGRRISHVAIALDRARFVHAPNSRGVVRIESIGQPYWSRRVVGARRVRAETTTDSH